MSSLNTDTRRQIEAYADGELGPADAVQIEALLRENAEANALLQTLRAIETIPQAAVEALSADVDFARMEDAIMGAIFGEEAGAPTRDAELEALSSAWVDGELHDPQQTQRVFGYLARVPAAREGIEGQREIGRLTRAYMQEQRQGVDFNAMLEATMAAIEEERATSTTTSASTTTLAGAGTHPNTHTGTTATDEAPLAPVVPLSPWYQRYKAPIAALAGIAAAFAIMMPLVLQQDAGTNITNHYYLTNVDNMDVEPGFSGTIVRGTPKAAPVVWISDEPESAPRSADEPLLKAHDATPMESEDADDDAGDDTLDDTLEL